MANKEFKVGDKCVMELEIVNANFTNNYPLVAKDKTGENWTFTSDGRHVDGNVYPKLKHIEDIISNPEYPKWMMVSSNQIAAATVKRLVIGKILNKYVALNDAVNENSINYKRYIENPNDDSINLTVWNYAKETEPENTIKQELLQKAQELIDKANELKNQAENL